MHASKDSMWQGILKNFWILGESKQGHGEGEVSVAALLQLMGER